MTATDIAATVDALKRSRTLDAGADRAASA